MFDKHFGFIFVATSLLVLKIQYHENRTFLFCLSISIVPLQNNKLPQLSLLLTLAIISLRKRGLVDLVYYILAFMWMSLCFMVFVFYAMG